MVTRDVSYAVAHTSDSAYIIQDGLVCTMDSYSASAARRTSPYGEYILLSNWVNCV